MEFEATSWGVWYYENHKEQCDELIRKLGVWFLCYLKRKKK
jgi:hypothetical protein